MNQASGQTGFLKPEWDAATVELWTVIDLSGTVSLFYLLNICVFGAHSRRKRTVTVSPSLLSACLIDAHATTGSLTDCWMNIPLIDVTDNWPDVPNLSPNPYPLSHSRTRCRQWVWVAWCVFAESTPETDFKTFRVGVDPAGRLASAADWCSWSCDEKRLFAPKDILLMNSSSNRAFREWNQWTVVCSLQGLCLLLLLNSYQTTTFCQV